ncbi:MAG: universal stress protein [Planctomycetota bacterium]
MNINKILCPVDFSRFSDIANRFASDLAAQTGAEIIYLTVPEQGRRDGNYEFELQRVRERELKKLKRFKPVNDGIKHSHVVEISVLTSRTIVEFAEKNDVDLIVIGSKGRTGLSRVLLGSVAESVIRKSGCPVLVVKMEDSSHAEMTEAVQNASTNGEN